MTENGTSTKLLTVEAVARMLTVSVPTVRRMMGRGELPVVRLGPRLVRFRLDDVEALMISDDLADT